MQVLRGEGYQEKHTILRIYFVDRVLYGTKPRKKKKRHHIIIVYGTYHYLLNVFTYDRYDTVTVTPLYSPLPDGTRAE